MSNAYEEGKKLLAEDRFAEAAERFAAALENAPNRTDILRRRAMAFFLDAEFEKALADINRAVAEAPEETENYLYRIFLRTAMDEAADASGDIEIARKLDPDSAKLHVFLTVHRLTQVDLAGATEAARRAVELDPKDDLTLYHLGICLSWNGLHEEADRLYQKAATIAARNLEKERSFLNVLYYGSICSALDRRELAREAMDEGVRRFSKLPVFYLWRADLNIACRDWEAARSDLDRAGEIIDRHSLWDTALFFGRATIYLQEDRNDLVPEQLEQVMQRIPDNPAALRLKLELAQSNFGNGRIGVEELSPVLETADLLCRLLPKNHYHYLLRHWFHDRLGNHDEAEADLDRLLRLLPDRADSQFHAALWLNDTGRTSIAMELFAKALKKEPDNVEYLRERGRAWLWIGANDMALKDLDRAVHLAGDDADLLEGRAVALSELGAYELFYPSYRKALDDLSRAIELKPDNDILWGRRAIVWNRIALKQWFGRKTSCQNAIDDYTEAVRLNPEDPYSWYGRAVVHRFVNDFDAAIDDCSEAVRIKPEFVEALRLRAECHRKNGNHGKAGEDEFTLARIGSAENDSAENDGGKNGRVSTEPSS